MATVIKANEQPVELQGAVFNLDDLTVKANDYLAKVRQQAAQIITDAKNEAVAIRQRAESDGRQSADQQADRRVEQKIAKQLEGTLPAVREAANQLLASRQAWVKHWEREAIKLATAIAEHIIRRELEQKPEITLDLVREALNLAASSGDLRLHMNPADVNSLGGKLSLLVEEFSRLHPTKVVHDDKITRGGCRVETRYGAIDQQIEVQLARIADELK